MCSPINDDELARLLRPLGDYDACVIAVSGGSDSTALMHLAGDWKRQHGGAGPDLVVATVDHGLRAGADADAREVARWAGNLGLACRVLRWDGPKPVTAVQQTAREMRYRLLVELARGLGAARVAIVTAHTEDDQAETVLMRLARGSGVDGLGGMVQVRKIEGAPGIELVRPLLGVSKARLVQTLKARGAEWIEDPSNVRGEFERVRLRRARDALAGLGLTSEPLALSARRLQRAKAALAAATADLTGRAVKMHHGAFGEIDRAALAAAPEEIQLRLLADVIARFGGGSRAPSLAQLEALHGRLAQGATLGATLGGTMIAVRPGKVLVFREPGRRGLSRKSVAPGERVIWDNRFLIGLGVNAPSRVEVRALGAEAYATFRRELRAREMLPARAAATLPALWTGNELIAVPHFSRSRAAGSDPDALCGARAGDQANVCCTIDFIW